MRAIEAWVESDDGNPLGDETGILACRYASIKNGSCREEEVARFLSSRPKVVFDRLAGLLAQLETNRSTGLLLAHRRPLKCISMRGHVLDFERDHIAAAQLAVDGQIEDR